MVGLLRCASFVAVAGADNISSIKESIFIYSWLWRTAEVQVAYLLVSSMCKRLTEQMSSVVKRMLSMLDPSHDFSK